MTNQITLNIKQTANSGWRIHYGYNDANKLPDEVVLAFLWRVFPTCEEASAFAHSAVRTAREA